MHWFTSAMTCLAQGCGECAIDAHTKAQVAVFVRGRQLQEDHVERQLTGTEQLLDLAKEDGRIVGASRGNRVAHVGAEEESIVAEMTLVLWQCVIGFAEGEHVKQFHVVQ
jgi:hypothetical protein